ncbi:hypothetical protein GALMADRAFT_229167 [Galerina marginata CBS 339.88]|uniref:HMG box domain-containing protein n=1 Tax=Galerina marginata (strain CBS 339.88) TaxID=685588 RepID=A0A067SNC4_GALM3|nr:hypothetical protein GALMADRAFT_229167 [Galerina marginata CBS 339.88]
MPAARTKALKRSDSTGNQFVWASQPESTNGTELSFSPAMTPINFSDSPPPLVDFPTEFVMFPPPDENPAPRKQPHSKKKPENHIPRPPNAFILFRSSFIKSQHVSTAVETNHSTLSKIIGLTWQSLPEEQRQVWHMKAKEALDEHKRKFPKYAFRPVQTKAKGAPSEKRKVREVEPKDIKRCTKIAQLLVEGKKGHELNEAIQEFDKHHVPEIVTRFEAPITARAFRRSSSAPIPDTETSRAGQSFFQQVLSSPRKIRSTSSRPTRCSTPMDVAEQNCSSPTGNTYLPVDSHAIPLKEEPSFSFGSFSFDNIASPIPTYDCDPHSLHQADSFDGSQYSPSLSVDTSFMSDWAPSPSPVSPSSPSYMMTPSPVLSSSPAPSFDGGFDFDHVLDKSFDDFSATFSGFQQSCGVSHSAAMCGGGVEDVSIMGTDALYAAFADQIHHHHPSAPLAHLDLDFSAFMTSIPQYAM